MRPVSAGWTTVLVTGALAASAGATERPEQFRVWGAVAKAQPYLGDPGLDSAGPMPAEASAAERALGFIVFSRGPATAIDGDFAPTPGDRCQELAARDCPGQYGPLTFGVLALQKGDFTAVVTDLTGPGGRTIGAENLDVRAVRYVKVTVKKETKIIPLLIESFSKKTVTAGRVQQFWITYYVPESAAPGAYRGTIRVRVNGAEKAAIPLTLEVYPFQLVEPDVDLFIYQGNWLREDNPAWSSQGLLDQRCHGMNTAGFAPPVTRDGELKLPQLTALLDTYRQVGFARRQIAAGLWNRITAEWLNTPDKSIGMYSAWFRYYPFSAALDDRYVAAARTIRGEAGKRGLKLTLSVADEPGSHPWTTAAAQHYNDLLKERLPDVERELTVGGGWAMNRPEDELWKGRINVWTTNRWLEDKLQLVRKNDPGARIAIYNMGGDGSGLGGIESVRAMYGFFGWKAGARGAGQWVYYHNATPECNYTWPAEDAAQGHVPTLRWEMVREGAKDRRYVATLEARLAGKQGSAVDEARAFLSTIAEQVVLRTDAYDPIGGGRIRVSPPGTYDQWRDRIAEFIRKIGNE